MKKDSRLILALDVVEKENALFVAKEVEALVDAIKIGYPLVLSSGLGVVKEISDIADVICDLKVADIPYTNRLIVSQAFEQGATGVIVHGFTGKDAVKACVEAAKGDVFLVVEMSHPGAEQFFQANMEKLAAIAGETNVTGVIAPATRPERVKRIRKLVGDLLILCPGVGTQGGKIKETIKAGADYLIVGRSIYQTRDPYRAAEQIRAEIKKCLL